MNATLKAVHGPDDLGAVMQAIGAAARAAARTLAVTPAAEKNRALRAMADAVRADVLPILKANDLDLAETRKAGAVAAFLDRLALDRKRVMAVADGLEMIASLPIRSET